MRLIDQHTKQIMEECKIYAKKAGLKFDNETLEYIVTNQDMIRLSPKVMIPTLYDYWVNDVEVLKGEGKYKVYPNNPYETVINSRPAISFYNDNNSDWMNVMIFYHVLGHIDFFQNNKLFEATWTDDFVGQALADKRLIASYRTKYHRWVDYVIEFARGIDNLVNYFNILFNINNTDKIHNSNLSRKLNYYFEEFLQKIKKVPDHVLFNEINRYNNLLNKDKDIAESLFFSGLKQKYPEFESLYSNYNKQKKININVNDFILENSEFLNKKENLWMKSVINIVKNTSMYFSPQIRSKIINEGWASYWHDNLFCQDKRIKGHEVGFAKLNSGVTSISRVGLNPYAIGLRLIQYVEDKANKGKLSLDFQKINDYIKRNNYNTNLNEGKKAIFFLRSNFSDFMLINTFVDQDFIDKYNLYVTGKRYNPKRKTIEYYVKSKKAEDYKKMLIDSLYHPPHIIVNTDKTKNNLYLQHKFEGKQLIKDFIKDTMIGIEYLWGDQVDLETTEIIKTKQKNKIKTELRKVLYTVKNKTISKKII